MLRIEFEDLLRNNERMIGALHFLSYITEIAENSATPDLIGMSDLLAVLADASRQQKDHLKLILTMTEQREQENVE
ncbi:hypothetical protein [Gallibacterium anatis]|uniref:hypothetical protein n=1 Tax=Gallibacterium anatis TaxID=750 RepID=UPI000530E7E6|nr:hypothetical protein [Gallibacterium anatis]KGQ39903.1 hypothetical protein JP30_09335 [Gallibacterium anatis IPDH697-78]